MNIPISVEQQIFLYLLRGYLFILLYVLVSSVILFLINQSITFQVI